ncbi:hypothetical protein AOQ88_00675 [Candidatus Riesia sp. GBBU]|nr:hypothetical protein AOQ88_00675 [Candidatus Riesia sp. GBBU]
MYSVYIAVGSNLKNPLFQVKNAIDVINRTSKIKIDSVSSMFFSSPMGLKDQPDYVNAVIHIITKLSPKILLKTLQSIEIQIGRIRNKIKWSSRIIDLDILFYDKIFIRQSGLIIPHYDVKNRKFFLYPLHEITNNFMFPDGELLKERLDYINNNKICKCKIQKI